MKGGKQAYIIFGPLDEIGGKINLAIYPSDVLIVGPANCGSFASTVQVADLDGDGCDDLIIGDPTAQPGSIASAGQISILFGRTDPPSQWQVNWLTGNPDLALYHQIEYANIGETIAVGDFNGDDHPDLAFSSFSYDTGNMVYVVLGPFAKTTGAVRDLASSPPDLVISSPVSSDNFGGSIDLADIDGDGKDDLLVGADNFYLNSCHGAASVIFGREVDEPETQDLGEDPADVTVFSGDDANFQLFAHRAYWHDLTGDGEIDLVLTDPFFRYDGEVNGSLAMIENSRLTSSGTTIDLTEESPDLQVVGLGSWWYFFERAAMFSGGDKSFPGLVAAVPFGNYAAMTSNGMIYRLDSEQLDDSFVHLESVDPAGVYYGSFDYYSLGDSLVVTDLDGNDSLDLIVGAKNGVDGVAKGVILVFFDQFSDEPPIDDDTSDDDTGDDDTVDDDTSDDDSADDDTVDDDMLDDDVVDDDVTDDDQTDDDVADDDQVDDDLNDDDDTILDDDDDDDDDGCGC